MINSMTDLNEILANLNPVLHPGVYVFCRLPHGNSIHVDSHPVCIVQEEEALTVIVTQAEADLFGWPYDYQAGWITLQVHSALSSVGVTAKISTALAEAEISCNMVAGYFHDHLFVPFEKVDQTMQILGDLAVTPA
jgi:uncharacterized protein